MSCSLSFENLKSCDWNLFSESWRIWLKVYKEICLFQWATICIVIEICSWGSRQQNKQITLVQLLSEHFNSYSKWKLWNLQFKSYIETCLVALGKWLFLQTSLKKMFKLEDNSILVIHFLYTIVDGILWLFLQCMFSKLLILRTTRNSVLYNLSQKKIRKKWIK